MKRRIVSVLCCLPLLLGITDKVLDKSNLHNKFKLNIQDNQYPLEDNKFKKIKEESEQLKKQQMLKEIGEGLKQQNEEKLREQKKQEEISSRGLTGEVEEVEEIKCHITYYTNINNSLQGGHYDKKGILLTDHQEPICALPSNIPYGSYLILDESINGVNKFKNVDTGDAITYLNDNTIKVDIFIPNVSEEWIINHLENKVVKGKIYYKE